MAHSQVPKFGNWESEENVPYTAYFDNARKGRKGGKMSPIDPLDNPGMFPKGTPSDQAPHFQQKDETRGRKGPEGVTSKNESHTSQEDGELRRLTDLPLNPDTASYSAATDSHNQQQSGVRSGSNKLESEVSKGSDALRVRHERQLSRDEGDLRPIDSALQHDSIGRRGIVDSPHHHHGSTSAGDTPKRVMRKTAGPDRSIEQSPLHPQYQTRVGGKGSMVSSPSWERKGSTEGGRGLGPSTPGRSRLRSVPRGDETPDRSPAVPKFGDWDENDPASAEGYSHIFNRVREERQSEAGKVPVMPNDNSYSNGQKQYENENSKSCCCFPWGRK